MKEKRKKIKEYPEDKAIVGGMRFLLPFAHCIIVLSLILAYANSLAGAFIFDDRLNIVDNPTIRNLADLRHIFFAPSGSGLMQRPVINASFALNYAISGLHPWSYHLVNLIIHMAAALTLFGIVRRTLRQNKLLPEFREVAVPLALACTLIWSLHPMQTSGVTYIVQRCESLMGLFFLLTLYCAIRGWQSPKTIPWHLTAVLSFLLGGGSKEVIIAAPVIVMIYDIVFINESIKEAFRKSWLMYAGFLFGLILLLIPAFHGGSVPKLMDRTTIPIWHYWLTQPEVILHYVRLAFWPSGLCFDYGWPLSGPGRAWPFLAILSLLMGITAWMFYKRNPLAVPAAAFFIILAPTSLMPLPDPAVEYRMYLPLAALTAMVVCGSYHFAARRIEAIPGKSATHFLLPSLITAVCMISILLGILTHVRNRVFMDNLTIWSDTAEKCPRNHRAQLNLGVELERAGEYDEALVRYREAALLKPHDDGAYVNLGLSFYRKGDLREAMTCLQEALRLNPRNVSAYSNLGTVLYDSGQKDKAREAFETALRLNPDQAEVLSNLGNLLNEGGRYDLAMVHLRKALRLRPEYAEAHANLGFSLEQSGRTDEAILHYQEALRINPSLAAVGEGIVRLMKQPQRNVLKE